MELEQRQKEGFFFSCLRSFNLFERFFGQLQLLAFASVLLVIFMVWLAGFFKISFLVSSLPSLGTESSQTRRLTCAGTLLFTSQLQKVASLNNKLIPILF